MPQSHAYMLVHLIFSTKERKPLIKREVRPELGAYIADVLQGQKCSPVIINAVADHVHALFFLARDVTLSAVVNKIKSNSSRWLKTKLDSDFSWQRGYSVFSVSKSNIDRVCEYIEGQEDHHRKTSFMDEVKNFLEKHGMDYDERYLWD